MTSEWPHSIPSTSEWPHSVPETKTLSWAIEEEYSFFLLHEILALYSLQEGCCVFFLLQERHSSSLDGVLMTYCSVVLSWLGPLLEFKELLLKYLRTPRCSMYVDWYPKRLLVGFAGTCDWKHTTGDLG